jgi:hypothetical protein
MTYRITPTLTRCLAASRISTPCWLLHIRAGSSCCSISCPTTPRIGIPGSRRAAHRAKIPSVTGTSGATQARWRSAEQLALRIHLLYQLHTDGTIWRYTGAPCSGNACLAWQMLDNNPAATAITAANRQLFQLHTDGTIWRYTGTPCTGASCPGWWQLNNNPATKAITGSPMQ